jgi:integrase
MTKKRRYIKRKAKPDTKSAALELARQLAQSIGRDAARPYGSPSTLYQLLEHFVDHYVFPAEYVEGRKIAGYRSHASITGYIDAIRATMKDIPMSVLTYGMIRNLRLALLKQETTQSRAIRKKNPKALPVTRTLANVHRILAVVRHALNIAEREAWIDRNPFEQGPPLINPKDEKSRQRICSREEETALLDACNEDERRHLRSVLICAFDTGMRRGEILSLDWNDVDLKHSVIRVRAFNTKTMTGREVPITSRLAFELRRTAKSLGSTGRVFSIAGVRRSFSTAKRLAKVEGLRFHDIRHTAATRMVEGGMSLAETGRILGHSEPRTTYRYTNANAATLERAAAIMEAYQASGSS